MASFRRTVISLAFISGALPCSLRHPQPTLLILLATVAAGRAAWGVVLVVAFGLGMAAVMSGTGLAFVYAGGLLDRVMTRRPARLAALVPITAAVAVLVLGLVLTGTALAAASGRC